VVTIDPVGGAVVILLADASGSLHMSASEQTETADYYHAALVRRAKRHRNRHARDVDLQPWSARFGASLLPRRAAPTAARYRDRRCPHGGRE
jgi:hypothetical protein